MEKQTYDFICSDKRLIGLDLNDEKKATLFSLLDSDNQSHLVTARAGSGKSTLLRSLIYALVENKKVNKDEILFLSFNKKVREENVDKIDKTFDLKNFYGAQTFDSLAYQIVKKPGNPVSVLMGQQIIEAIGSILRKQSSLLFKLKYWWYLGELDKEFTPETGSQTTFLKEEVKSFGEKSIANYLFEYNLDYIYEPVFEWLENQYRPDFMIVQNNVKVIIEYFGLNTQEYLRQAARKKAYWESTDYHFIEMWYADIKGGEGEFLNKLQSKLIKTGLILRPLTDEEKAEKIFETRIPKIAEEIEKFISYAQAQCLTPLDVKYRLENKEYTSNLSRKDIFFAEFAQSVFEGYGNYIQQNNVYDFPKLKNTASEMIRATNGECTINYGEQKEIKVCIKNIKWILIDEFQDFSPTFNNLIQSILSVNTNIKIVCVGDDWQAINGFAGSTTEYIENFERYFPNVKRHYLLTNFRSRKQIVDKSNELMSKVGGPIATSIRGGGLVKALHQDVELYAIEEILQNYIRATQNIILSLKSNGFDMNVTILHRNNKIFGIDLDYFLNKVKYKQNFQTKINISTIHQYKGAENDIVIVLNVTSNNHPMLHPDRTKLRILGQNDYDIELSERKLFYVALTRAKEGVFLLTNAKNHSVYLNDIGMDLSN